MSDQHGSMQPVRPLTRREIREREAAAAEQAAGAAPSAPGGYAPPPAQAQAPAGPPPSRRSMRDVSAPTPADGHSTQAPVVRPPSMTGGMRGVDETGRLTPIQETAERVAIRPAQTPPPGMTPPVRQSMRAPSTAPSPFATSTRPPAPEQAPQNAPTPFPPAQPSSPFPPARESVASRTPAPETPRAAATPAPAPAALPWEQSTPSGLAQQSPEPTRAALPWETQAPAPSQQPAPASPFPGAPSAGSQGPDEASPFPLAGSARQSPAARGADDDEDDAVDERPPGHAYTWLHYLILIAVAFVLGLLIWKLLLGEGPSIAEPVAPVGIEALASSLTYHHGLSS